MSVDNPSPEIRVAMQKKLDALELSAWDHLRHHRFFQAMGMIELWHIVHMESGLRLPNPFQDVAHLGREKYRNLINRERS
jgi:hypothetical protein